MPSTEEHGKVMGQYSCLDGAILCYITGRKISINREQ